jgi:hypothetical protein
MYKESIFCVLIEGSVMSNTFRFFPSVGVALLLFGCGAGDTLFRGQPDVINVDVSEGQTKAITLVGGEVDSTYQWSVVSGLDFLSISTTNTDADEDYVENESPVIYVTAEQVTETVSYTVQAVELTTQGDSRTHKFAITIVDVPVSVDPIKTNENSIIDVDVNYSDRNNTFTWEQLSGPSLVLDGAGISRRLTIPSVDKDEVAVLLIKETSESGFYKETEIIIDIQDIPSQVIDMIGVAGEKVKVEFPNGKEGSSYAWTVKSGADITIEGLGDVVYFVMPDLLESEESIVEAVEIDSNSLQTTVNYHVVISPQAVKTKTLTFTSDEKSVLISVEGGPESTYEWIQVDGPDFPLDANTSNRITVDIPQVSVDTLVTFLVKETTVNGSVIRTNLNIYVTLDGAVDSVLNRSLVAGDLYPSNTNITPTVSVSNDGFAVAAYKIKYTSEVGIDAVVKDINTSGEWVNNGLVLDRAEKIDYMDVASSKNKAVIAYTTKNDDNTSLKYIKYGGDSEWGQPSTLIPNVGAELTDISVSLNESGAFAISYIKHEDALNAYHYVATVSESGTLTSSKVSIAGVLTRSSFEDEVEAINERNIDGSINYVLSVDDVMTTQPLVYGSSTVHIDNNGIVSMVYTTIESTSFPVIVDPTIEQQDGDPERYADLTDVPLEFTIGSIESHSLKATRVVGQVNVDHTIANSTSTIGYSVSKALSGKYAVSFHDLNQLGLKDLKVTTFNMESSNGWSEAINVESYDDKSYSGSSVSMNERGDLFTAAKYEAVNGEQGVQISSFNVFNLDVINEVFIDDAPVDSGVNIITSDQYGNALFGFVTESGLSLYTYSKSELKEVEIDVVIDGAITVKWDSNSKGEMVFVYHNDVDSGFVHTKQN